MSAIPNPHIAPLHNECSTEIKEKMHVESGILQQCEQEEGLQMAKSLCKKLHGIFINMVQRLLDIHIYIKYLIKLLKN